METEVLLIKKRGRKPIKKVDVLDLPVIEKGVRKSTFITVDESDERTLLKPSTDEVTLTDLNIERLEDHPYNNYPDDNPEDFLDLKKSLEYADFDARFPIWVRTD